MRSSGKTWKRWLLATALLALGLAFGFWMIRPSPYGDWLGLVGLGEFTPLYVIRQLADRRVAPRTPLGFLSVFPPGELLVGGALLSSLAAVAMLLWNAGRDPQPGTGLSRRIRLRWPRGFSLRVRTSLILVAVVALEMGWEVVAWRAWRLREIYLIRASRLSSEEIHHEAELKRRNLQLANLEAGHGLAGEQELYTGPARAAILAYERDRLMRKASASSLMVTRCSKLRRKYEAAAEDPLRPIPPDPVLPEQEPELDPDYWIASGEYDRALAGSEEMIRVYPDHPSGHDSLARLLATCPDARYRDGKLAVQSARCACELTRWKDPQPISTLAAAYAEAGDFANAIAWQEKARGLSDSRSGRDDDRLNLYKAGKPFRLSRPPRFNPPSLAAPHTPGLSSTSAAP